MIPGSELVESESLMTTKFTNLEQIAEASPQATINFVGIIQKVGPVGEITLKNGDSKQRRNLVVIDESMLSCVICFWSDKHLKKLDGQQGQVGKGERLLPQEFKCK